MAPALNWQPITTVNLPPATGPIDGRPYRAQFSTFLLETAAFPTQLRPAAPLEVSYQGYGSGETITFTLQPVGAEQPQNPSRPAEPTSPAAASPPEPVHCALFMVHCQGKGVYTQAIDTTLPNGRYQLIAAGEGAAVCGWFHRSATGCVLGEVEISGVALASGATNFDDQIALLDVNLGQESLQPGGQLSLELNWQALAPINESYTVFVQVLNEQEQIVGQVDSWPVQGTRPTSQWTVGELIDDPYTIQLQGNLSPGPYRLHIGWYLLATLRRLPILDENGNPVDDKVVIEGLAVPQSE